MTRAHADNICSRIGVTLAFLISFTFSDQRFCNSAFGQEITRAQIEQIDSRTRRRLVQLESYIQNEQWDDAISVFRILSRPEQFDGARLHIGPPTPEGFQYAIPVHRHLHKLMARLPKEQVTFRQLWRERNDPIAEELLASGRQSARIDAIWQIVDRFYNSRAGDDALLRLGDEALRNGHFTMARGYWRCISPSLRTERGYGPYVSYPDTTIDLAIVRARLALSFVLEGKPVEAEKELSLLAKHHPNARGVLGGIETDLHETVVQFYRPPTTRRTAPSSSVLRLRPSPIWRLRLPQRQDVTNLLTSSQPATRRPFIRPTIFERHVVFADRSRLFVHDLGTGKPVSWSERDGAIYTGGNDSEPTQDWLTFGNTPVDVVMNRSIACGVTESLQETNLRSERRVTLVDLADEGRLLLNSRLGLGTDSDFISRVEVDGERMMVAVRDSSSPRQISVLTFNQFGPLRITPICRGESYDDEHAPQAVLVRVDDQMIAVTQAGAIAAIESSTGKIRWVTTYPRGSTKRTNLLARPWFRYRSKSVPVIDNGILYVAPADHDGLLGIDTFSGEVVFQTRLPADTFDPVEILGVTEDYVIASGRRIWWLDRVTGELVRFQHRPNPFPAPIDTDIICRGTGLVRDGVVYWPTLTPTIGHQILTFDADSGIALEPISLAHAEVDAGNLTIAGQTLLITGDDEIVALPTEESQNNGE